MKAEQQQQAQSLYFQTELTKTEIAQIVGVSPRTLHYWASHNHWDTIKQHARNMPVAIAGNCYLILGQLQDSILSPKRAGKPVTPQEVNAMHRLVSTINKLTGRATLNENLEMMTHFMTFVGGHDPRLTAIIEPVVAEYIRQRAAATSMLAAAAQATTPGTKPNDTEDHLDREGIAARAAAIGSTSAATTTKVPTPKTPPATVAATTVPKATDTTMPAPTKQVAQAAKPEHIIKGKANNRAARRAQARSAARQGLSADKQARSAA